MSGGVVIVFAFDPVEELEGRSGVLQADAELGGRLVAEHRAELVAEHAGESMRYVAGSAAFDGARDALRSLRATTVRKTRRPAKLES